MKKLYALLGLVALVSGCAASRLEDRVIDRSDNLKERPSWAKVEDSGYSCIVGKDGSVKKGVASNGERYFCSLGVFTRSAKKNTNIAQLMKSAETDSKAAIISTLETKLQENTEKATEDFEGDASVLRNAIASSSKGLLRGVRVAKKYWEKKLVNTEDGQSFQFDVYVLSYISEKDLRDSIDAMAKKKSLSPETKELLKKAGSYAFSEE